jgi:hypothetical protein
MFIFILLESFCFAQHKNPIINLAIIINHILFTLYDCIIAVILLYLVLLSYCKAASIKTTFCYTYKFIKFSQNYSSVLYVLSSSRFIIASIFFYSIHNYFHFIYLYSITLFTIHLYKYTRWSSNVQIIHKTIREWSLKLMWRRWINKSKYSQSKTAM